MKTKLKLFTTTAAIITKAIIKKYSKKYKNNRTTTIHSVFKNEREKTARQIRNTIHSYILRHIHTTRIACIVVTVVNALIKITTTTAIIITENVTLT